jgi:hypothetical protein
MSVVPHTPSMVRRASLSVPHTTSFSPTDRASPQRQRHTFHNVRSETIRLFGWQNQKKHLSRPSFQVHYVESDDGTSFKEVKEEVLKGCMDEGTSKLLLDVVLGLHKNQEALYSSFKYLSLSLLFFPPLLSATTFGFIPWPSPSLVFHSAAPTFHYLLNEALAWGLACPGIASTVFLCFNVQITNNDMAKYTALVVTLVTLTMLATGIGWRFPVPCGHLFNASVAIPSGMLYFVVKYLNITGKNISVKVRMSASTHSRFSTTSD